MSDFSRLMEWAYAHGSILPPEPVAAPIITGNLTVGQVLTCSTGTWRNNPASYAYAWNRAGAPIGTNSSTYTTVAGEDVGWAVRCVVTATNASGSGVSSPSDAVVPHA